MESPVRRRALGEYDVLGDSDDDALDVEEYPLRSCVDCINLFFRTGELKYVVASFVVSS